MPSLHPLRPPSFAATPAWPTFRGTARLVGTSSRGVTVYVDQRWERRERRTRSDLSSADNVLAQNDAIFAAVVSAGSIGGARSRRHIDRAPGAVTWCDFTTGNAIEVDASFGSPNRVIGLFEAELSECAMNGSLCGYSTGEALSRWCATVVSSNALADFATAPDWAQAGMPDWVNQTEHTDQDAVSTGCGMAFISWLLSQGHHLSQIAHAMVALGDSGTLAQAHCRTASRIAAAVTVAAAVPSTATLHDAASPGGAGCSAPEARQNTTSPSSGVKAGSTARAMPAPAMRATIAQVRLSTDASVQTHASVVLPAAR